MKTKQIKFNAKELLRSVEEVRDHVTGRRKITLRTTWLKLPKPAPAVSPRDVEKIRARLKVSQPVFARYLNTSESTVEKWESGAKRPSGMALKLLDIAEKHGLKVLA